MERLAAICTGILTFATALAGAHDRATTIEAFYDTTARTRVIAHRGFSGAAPENTLSAVRAAIEIGADMVEIDVTLSGDGKIVVIHDETVNRTTDGEGEVADTTLADLRLLDAGSWFDPRFAGERIPTLDEVLAEVEGRILLNIEIKGEAVDRGIVGEVASAVREHGMNGQVVISSFSPAALQEMAAVASEIRTAVLYNTDFHLGRDAVDIVSDLGASTFNIKRQRLTRKMLRRCQDHDIPVGIYTVNQPRRMRRLINKGVDAIFTDQPDLLIEILNRAQTPVPAPTRVPATTTP